MRRTHVGLKSNIMLNNSIAHSFAYLLYSVVYSVLINVQHPVYIPSLPPPAKAKGQISPPASTLKQPLQLCPMCDFSGVHPEMLSW